MISKIKEGDVLLLEETDKVKRNNCFNFLRLRFPKVTKTDEFKSVAISRELGSLTFCIYFNGLSIYYPILDVKRALADYLEGYNAIREDVELKAVIECAIADAQLEAAERSYEEVTAPVLISNHHEELLNR